VGERPLRAEEPELRRQPRLEERKP
jgi:hypothetical protein